MTIYISVVSHGHSDLINKLSCLNLLCDRFKVIVKSNIPNDDFYELSKKQNFSWINENYYCGFGNNNNIVFSYCRSELNMNDSDYFIVLNPDVDIDAKSITKLVKNMEKEQVLVSSINLYKDNARIISDNSIRKFPSLRQFVSSFLGLGNTSIIDKSQLLSSCKVDWAAGSFLSFKVIHYKTLRGFDEQYFMYCEDIDICYRSYLSGVSLVYYPEIIATHFAEHANRKFFSKHFYWHVSSVVRFLLTKSSLTKPHSSVLLE
ncbi:MAG: glycosyltransferase family 2 protein [Saccharospirillaceae bacterium]|nr:glycosyltransferase family 2 protein [Saccharospirillaceae bacterium]